MSVCGEEEIVIRGSALEECAVWTCVGKKGHNGKCVFAFKSHLTHADVEVLNPITRVALELIVRAFGFKANDTATGEVDEVENESHSHVEPSDLEKSI